MPRLLLLFFFLILHNISFSQENTLDSLLHNLELQKERDTSRINRLVDLSNHHFLGDINKAEPYLIEAINIATEIDDLRRASKLKAKLAKQYIARGLNNEALEQILGAVKILDTIDAEPTDRILVLNVLSTVYRAYDNNEKSLEVSLEVLELAETLPLTNEVPRYHYNIGQTYSQLGQNDKSEIHYLQALEIADQLNETHIKSIMTSVLGDHYKKIGKYKKAESLINQIIPYYKENKQDRNLGSSYRTLAHVNSLQGKHKASIPFYEKALEIFERTGNLYFAKKTNQELFIAYSIAEDQPKAEAANARYIALKDSLDSKERKALIAKMETEFETEKIKRQKELAEKELAITELENKRNRNLFIGAVIVGILTLLSSLFYFERLKAKKQAEMMSLELSETQKRLTIEKQYRDSELKALKAQMNPHFIFNALNAIQEYILLNQKNLASDYLGKFADLIRNYLHYSNTGFISISEEIKNLNLYLELEKLRFEDNLFYTINTKDNLEESEILIPTMLIQPYVENALKHGLLHKPDNRQLIIEFSKADENTILCVVEDNGVGREKAKQIKNQKRPSHQSFAHNATKERLALLNYGKTEQIGVDITDIKDSLNKTVGTKVTLHIPIENRII